LALATEQTAAWLARRGIGAGDHVAVLLANCPALPAVYFALWEIGAVCVPISIRTTAGELAALLDHGRARALIADGSRLAVARAAAHSVHIPLFTFNDAPPLRPAVVRKPPATPTRVPRPARPHDLAVITYTSGTTGKPKGVMLTHANLMWSALACSGARGDTAESVGAAISPLSHTPVFVSHLLCRILHGSTAVLFDGFHLDAILEAAVRHRISDLSLIAGMVFDVVQKRRLPASLRRTVRKVTVGGAATPMQAKEALRELFHPAEIIEAYGQSESTNGVTMARGDSVFAQPGTVGRVNPFVTIAVRRRDGSLAEPGEEGELVIGGPTVMLGYYRDRQATAAALRDGWLHTGDLGRCDPGGHFYITGRVKNLIITGGENVSPVEIEDVLRRHPAVADVAVIGTPHPKWGEQVTAVIVPQPGIVIDRSALLEFAGRHLAGFKKPRRIEIVDRLPRNAANKVQTGLLKQRFADT
jgi:acyl-CoA synthetase (AMP-forming)/AMP-acid ligase II